MIIEYEGKKPRLGLNVFIAPTATVIGDVEIKDNASIWYGTVVRGDRSPIVIGRNTNIQDNCTVHTDEDSPAVIGDNVTIGHNAVVHGCVIEDRCLIGISAAILSYAMVGEGTIVAAGSVVIEKQKIGPYHLVAGIPAKIKTKFEKKSTEALPASVKNYLKIAGNHMAIYQHTKLP